MGHSWLPRRGARWRMVRALLLLACAGALASGCQRNKKSAPSADDAAKTFAVIPKGTTHEYWKSVHAGAVKAARELGAQVVWKGPVREDDRDDQIKVMETFLAKGVDGIVLAPLDDRALIPVLDDAKARKIPVVIIDSAVQWNGYVSYVATDNARAGGLAATALGTELGGKGQVVVLRYQTGSASTSEREEGFLATLRKEYPGISVVSDNQYGGATTESAFAASENLLSTHKDVQGIFCPNESTTFGMLRALSAAGRAGKVHLFGFDASPKLVDALRAGEIDGLVVQDPLHMGETALRSLVDFTRGKPVKKRVDTGAVLVMRQNMDEPAVRRLLAPDLTAYLP